MSRKPFAGEVVLVVVEPTPAMGSEVRFYHGGVEVSPSEAKELEDGGAALTFDETRQAFSVEAVLKAAQR